MKKIIITTSSIFFLFLLWIIIWISVNHPILVPSPKAIFISLGLLFTNSLDVTSILLTLLRIITTLVICYFLGVITGFIAYKFNNLETFLKPLVAILRSIPTICIIVILSVVFGLWWSPFIITFLLLFPITYQGTLDGLKAIDIRYIYLFKVDSSSFIKSIYRVYLPLIGKNLITTFIQCAGLSIKVMIMSEYLVQTKNSIGFLLYDAKTNLDYAKVIALSLVIIIISLIVEVIPFLIKELRNRTKAKVLDV